MARNYWLMFAIAAVLIKHNLAVKPTKSQEGPLAKTTGISKPKHGSVDRHLGQEYVEQYQDMLRASQEFESSDDRDQRRLRRVIGSDDFDLMAEDDNAPRRRRGSKLYSSVAERRARSQAARKQKLTHQGMRSHIQHSKQTNLDYSDY